MRLKALVISFFILLYPVNTFASNEFKKAEDELGVIDRVIEIDEEFYFIFTEEQAVKMLSDIEKINLYREESLIYKNQLDAYKSIVKEKDFLIKLMSSERDLDKSIIDNLSKSKPWYVSDIAMFAAGILTSSALFGFWTYTNMKVD
jgi:hypothetical protein